MIKTVLAITALLSPLAAPACDTSKTPSPAPVPHPTADPNENAKTFPGSIVLTFWIEQDQDKTTDTVRINGSPHNRTGHRPGSHWDMAAKPNDAVSFSVSPFPPGDPGRIWIQVVQANNGRILCTGSNSVTYGHGPATCEGHVVV
jgi:hypothetical protein